MLPLVRGGEMEGDSKRVFDLVLDANDKISRRCLAIILKHDRDVNYSCSVVPLVKVWIESYPIKI